VAVALPSPHAVVSGALTKTENAIQTIRTMLKTKAAVLSKRLLKARFRLNAMAILLAAVERPL
jgi:hypothetical protein